MSEKSWRRRSHGLVGLWLLALGCARQHQVPPGDAAPSNTDGGGFDASPAPPDATAFGLDSAPEASPLGADGATDAGEPSGMPSFCTRAEGDPVALLFCRPNPPTIDGLATLQRELDIVPQLAEVDEEGLGRAIPVVVAHSTALSGQLVSPINPRLILIGLQTTFAFQRGVQKVELATFAPGGRRVFYLIEFRQACNERPEGCDPGDLYSRRIEENWLDITIRDDEDLKNTAEDCRSCHQRGRTEGVLLMRELRAPWTHFLFADNPDAMPRFPGVSGIDLYRDFRAAHGDESYGGVSALGLSSLNPFALEVSVEQSQPLFFDSGRFEDERWPYVNGEYTDTPQVPPTWTARYQAFRRGEQLALPHYLPRPTDAAKQARLTDAYRRMLSGELDMNQLPDLADIFPDDPAMRAEIGLQNDPNSSPPELLIEVCGVCHNDILDPTVTRARFNIDLTRMSRANLDSAIERMQRDPNSAGFMPPRSARQLDSAASSALAAYLRQNTWPDEDIAMLRRAAELGMNGDGRD